MKVKFYDGPADGKTYELSDLPPVVYVPKFRSLREVYKEMEEMGYYPDRPVEKARYRLKRFYQISCYVFERME